MSLWSAMFNGGKASDGSEEEEYSWWQKGLSLGGEVADRAVGVTYNTAGTLGGVTATLAGEGAQKINDASLSLGFQDEAKYAEAEDLLEGFTAGAKTYTAVSAGNLVNTIDPTTVDSVQRIEESEGFWDLFFQDSAQDIGDGMTGFVVGAETEMSGEQLSLSEIEDLRANVAKIEDEVLFTLFTFLTVAQLPKLRVLLAAASPGIIAMVVKAAVEGTNLAKSVVDYFMNLMGIIPEGDEEQVEDVTEAKEEEILEEEGEDEVTTEATVVDEESMPEQVIEPSVFEETWSDRNKYMDIEIAY